MNAVRVSQKNAQRHGLSRFQRDHLFRTGVLLAPSVTYWIVIHLAHRSFRLGRPLFWQSQRQCLVLDGQKIIRRLVEAAGNPVNILSLGSKEANFQFEATPKFGAHFY